MVETFLASPDSERLLSLSPKVLHAHLNDNPLFHQIVIICVHILPPHLMVYLSGGLINLVG